MAKSNNLDSAFRRRPDTYKSGSETSDQNDGFNASDQEIQDEIMENESDSSDQELDIEDLESYTAKSIGPLMLRLIIAGALLAFWWEQMEGYKPTRLLLGQTLLTRSRRQATSPLVNQPVSAKEMSAYNNILLSESYRLAAEDNNFDISHQQKDVRERRLPSDASSYTVQNIGNWYQCNLFVCKLPDCQCASQRPPAGLDKSVVPQFVVFTVEDAVHGTVIKSPLSVIEGIQNQATTCPVKATYFVSGQWSDYHDLQELWTQGHEIAGHTYSHTSFPVADDISAMRQAAEQYARIPANQINGFRAPSLLFSLKTLSTLRSLGFEYDSSMTVFTNGNNTVWPFTFDYGMPLSCATGRCEGATPPTPGQRAWKAPGLWEIPIYALNDPQYPGANWPIDPPVDGDALMKMLMQNFDDHYYGNRAPFGLHIHAAWLMAVPSRINTLNTFLKEISKRIEVRITTNQELLAWLRNPQPLSQMPDKVTCPGSKTVSNPVEICDGLDNNNNGLVDEGVGRECNFGTVLFKTCASSCPVRYPSIFEPVPQPSKMDNVGTECQPPMGGCVYGTYNRTTCACSCFGPGPRNEGSCPTDRVTGQCNVYRVPSQDVDSGFLDCASSSNVIVEDRKTLEEEFDKEVEGSSGLKEDDAVDQNSHNSATALPFGYGAVVMTVIISLLMFLDEL